LGLWIALFRIVDLKRALSYNLGWARNCDGHVHSFWISNREVMANMHPITWLQSPLGRVPKTQSKATTKHQVVSRRVSKEHQRNWDWSAFVAHLYESLKTTFSIRSTPASLSNNWSSVSLWTNLAFKNRKRDFLKLCQQPIAVR
jgi:hypothetical protein